MRLLVVEDEHELATLMRGTLERAGFAVDLAPDLTQARDHLGLVRYDALVLDLALPDGDGLSLLRRLRANGATVAVLVLTARDGPEDRVTGLDAGADDYLVKPFHMPELVARVRALLRRPNAALGVTLGLGNLVLDTTTRQTRVDGVDIGLSVRETAMLELLLRRQNCVVTRELLEQGLYSFDSQLGSNAMEVLVHRLRRKLADAAAALSVHTVRGVGYMLTASD
jgi:DNA-binding response OmpR family regulator